VGCLPRESIRLVLDILENPDATTPYTNLKRRLLDSHELMDFQRMELLHRMEPLGARKPSELLSQMLEACPRGQENNMFFLFLFLQRMPKELRVLFPEDDLKNPRDLAAKADKHWALLSHQHGTVAAIEAAEDDTAIATVQSGQYCGRSGRHGRGQCKRCRGGYHATAPAAQDSQAAAATPHSTAPGTLARLATSLCHFHWSYGRRQKGGGSSHRLGASSSRSRVGVVCGRIRRTRR
jgi:hypothetical protein